MKYFRNTRATRKKIRGGGLCGSKTGACAMNPQNTRIKQNASSALQKENTLEELQKEVKEYLEKFKEVNFQTTENPEINAAYAQLGSEDSEEPEPNWYYELTPDEKKYARGNPHLTNPNNVKGMYSLEMNAKKEYNAAHTGGKRRKVRKTRKQYGGDMCEAVSKTCLSINQTVESIKNEVATAINRKKEGRDEDGKRHLLFASRRAAEHLRSLLKNVLDLYKAGAKGCDSLCMSTFYKLIGLLKESENNAVKYAVLIHKKY